jgi:hypothetical protein
VSRDHLDTAGFRAHRAWAGGCGGGSDRNRFGLHRDNDGSPPAPYRYERGRHALGDRDAGEMQSPAHLVHRVHGSDLRPRCLHARVTTRTHMGAGNELLAQRSTPTIPVVFVVTTLLRRECLVEHGLT